MVGVHALARVLVVSKHGIAQSGLHRGELECFARTKARQRSHLATPNRAVAQLASMASGVHGKDGKSALLLVMEVFIGDHEISEERLAAVAYVLWATVLKSRRVTLNHVLLCCARIASSVIGVNGLIAVAVVTVSYTALVSSSSTDLEEVHIAMAPRRK